LTTLYIRHPAKASVDGSAAGSLPPCQFALAGDGGNLLQQGAAALSSLGDLVASARRVVLLLSAADVTLLRVKMPPLSPSKLQQALPNLVEEQILGDPADCVLAASSVQDGDGQRAVAVAQRAWLAAIVQVLQGLGAHGIAVLPAQLCLPLAPGGAAAAIEADDVGLQLTLRLGPGEGLGLSTDSQPLAALQTLRAFAGETPLTLYLAPALLPLYQPLLDVVPGITLETDHWAHWISAAKGAGIDLAPALGSAGAAARQWLRWRWPLRLAALLVLLNIVGLNIEWLRLKRDADLVRASISQTFRSLYPKEPLTAFPLEQMRRHLAAIKADSGGEVAPDEFTALCAGFGEAMNILPRKALVASIDYREHALFVKLKPDSIDGAAQAQVKAALAARRLALSEPNPGTWQIRPETTATAAAAITGKAQENTHE
jgi:general secretion pathway protein L